MTPEELEALKAERAQIFAIIPLLEKHGKLAETNGYPGIATRFLSAADDFGDLKGRVDKGREADDYFEPKAAKKAAKAKK